MPGKIDLAEARRHLRLGDDETSEDQDIESWIAAAYEAIEGKIFRAVYDEVADIPEADLTGIATTKAINSVARLIVGQLYENREATSEQPRAVVPMAVEWLLEPYVNYAGGL